MLLTSFIPIVVAALAVQARPHVQPLGVATPGSDRAPLPIDKVNQEIHPTDLNPRTISTALQFIQRYPTNAKIQANFQHRRHIPSVGQPAPESIPGGLQEGMLKAQHYLHKRAVSEANDLEELDEIIDTTVQGSDMLQVHSTWGDLPSKLSTRYGAQRRLGHKAKRAVPYHDFKATEPSEDKETPEDESSLGNESHGKDGATS
ncbi:hypothetical protein M408DRAFT_327427 [Serendipita vermifera MAFF 305830]|uniref:Uncharacterized protein n=1 Tax=Serendipita vermifera MAFF 305830 TaxID=933852 RepID=A0A0C3BI37_SERVB|nr:hypothetical protein M408DRAFT_327427 [Serendipita vermifera MAFF 305830]